MITLPRGLLDWILAHAQKNAPNEVCGWLAGEGKRIRGVYPVPNVAEEPRTSFRMDPKIQLSTMREITARGLQLTGTYHSHPSTPALPSPRDKSLACYPESSHLIVSLENSRPEVRCYRITQKSYTAIEVVIL